jgi:hypothetical protein
MLIDCEGCKIRGAGCGSCVVTLFLDAPSPIYHLGAAEAEAIETLALAGFDVTVIDPMDEERPVVQPLRPRRWSAA